MRILAQAYPNREVRVSVSELVPDKMRSQDKDRSLTLAANSTVKSRSEGQKVVFEGKVYRPGFGMTPRKTRFGLRAKRTILRVGGSMDGLSGWNCCVTLTLPANTKESFQTLADYSSYAIDRFKNWLANVVFKGQKLRYFYVWELQKRGALHIHLCVNVQTQKTLRILKQETKYAWIRILKLIEKETGCNLFLGQNGRDWRHHPQKIQVDVQVVRRSVAAYFAKYCSKDKGHHSTHVLNGLRPVRWWGCSRLVLKEMREQSVAYLSPVLFPTQAMGVMSELVQFVKDRTDKAYLYEKKYTNFMSFVGYLSEGDFEEVKEKLKEVYKKQEVCKFMNDGTHPRYPAVREGFIRQWENNERRVRLYNLFRDDRDAWEVFIYWMVDEAKVEQDVIVGLWDRFIVRKDDPSEALGTPQQIDFLGDDWW